MNGFLVVVFLGHGLFLLPDDGRPIGRRQSVILPLTAGRHGRARACTRPHDHTISRSASRSPRRRAPTRSWSAPARSPRLGTALDEAGIGPSRFVVSNPTVWGFWGEAFHEALPEAAPIIVPDGERYKTPAGVGRDLRRAAQGRRRPVRGARHLRRRRHRRHGRLRGRHLHARHPPGPRADDAAGAGRRRDRRQGGRQPARGQEPRRRLLPAVGRRDRSRRARDAAPPRVPGRALRGHQVRRGLRRRRCSSR